MWYIFQIFYLGSHWLNNNRTQRSNSNNISNHNSDCESPSVNDTDGEIDGQDGGSNTKSSQGGQGQNNSGSETTLHGTISEKHVYKYRCAQCSLAFKTAEKLALHSQYHVSFIPNNISYLKITIFFHRMFLNKCKIF